MLTVVTLVNGIRSDYISVDDRGLNYGDGLFETVLVKNNKPVFWEKHWQRLVLGAKILNINCPSEESLLKDFNHLLQNHHSGVLKLIITRGQSTKRGYQYAVNHTSTRIVRFYPDTSIDDKIDANFSLKYSQYPLMPSRFAGIKHLNRIEQIIAKSELQNTDFDEVICCDTNDNIVECASANIFIVIDNALYTPLISSCGVKGIIREWVLETAALNNINAHEVVIAKDMLNNSTEIFVCNSILGIQAVNNVEALICKSSQMTGYIKSLYEDALAK